MFGVSENILLELQDSLRLVPLDPALQSGEQGLYLLLAEEVQCGAERLFVVKLVALSEVSLQLPQTASCRPNLGQTEDALHRQGGHTGVIGEDATLHKVAGSEKYQIEKKTKLFSLYEQAVSGKWNHVVFKKSK